MTHSYMLGAVALIALFACATDGTERVRTLEAESPAAATVNGDVITIGDLDQWIKDDLFRQKLGTSSDTALYTLRKEAIGRMIDKRLLEREAASRGLEPEALLEAELEARGGVTDQEVEEFHEENKARIRGGGELEKLAPGIRSYLEGLRASEIVGELRSAAAVTIQLEGPRKTVDGSGPSRGPADAAVVIVEFSDYQCPFCRRAEPTLNEILERYPTQVRWEYRHFPLANHPYARPAAEAAVCAEAQGKFWEYHERLFSLQGKLDAAGLIQYAQEVELEMTQFETCLQAPDTGARVTADQQAGMKAGASGTPAFFVNGIFLNGARPIEAFEELIQAELARAGL